MANRFRPIHAIRAWDGPYSANETPICGATAVWNDRTVTHSDVTCPDCLAYMAENPDFAVRLPKATA